MVSVEQAKEKLDVLISKQWAIMHKPIQIARVLASECESSLKGETSPDCRVRCLNCGILASFKDSRPELSCITDFP